MPKLLFRVNSNQKMGTGHLFECMVLAKSAQIPSVFCLAPDKHAVKLIKQFGFPARIIRNEIADLNALIEKEKPDVVIFDIIDLGDAYLRKINPRGAKILALNALLHPVKADAQVATVFTPHAKNKTHYGAKFVLLRPRISETQAVTIKTQVRNILIMFGGGDPGNFTAVALRALAAIPGKFNVTIIMGGANKNLQKISTYLRNFPKPHELHHNITDDKKLIRLMTNADLALASGGYTLSELLHFGIPTLGLAQNTIEQKRIFRNFPSDSFVSLGLGDKISAKQLATATHKLMNDHAKRTRLSKKASLVVDGHGTSRVQKIIQQLIQPRVLILGASGNLGRLLARNLNANKPVSLFKGDILDRRNLEKQIAKNDVIINLVGASTDKGKEMKAQFDLNVTAQALLLDVCKDKEIKRIIFPSSLNVYRPLKRASRETDPTEASDPYTLTKILAEQVYRYYSNHFGIPVTILRLGSVYGPSRSKGILHRFAETIKDSRSITIPKTPAFRDLLHQDDLLDLINRVMDYNQKTFTVFNGSSGKRVSFRALALLARKLFPEVKIKYNNDLNVSTWGDNSKSKRILGFIPHIKLEQGLKRVFKN